MKCSIRFLYECHQHRNEKKPSAQLRQKLDSMWRLFFIMKSKSKSIWMIFFFDNSIEDFFCDNEVNFILKDQSKSTPVDQHYFMPIRESINNRILSSSICDLRPPPGFENEPMFSSPLTSSLCQINDSPSPNIPIDEENLQYLVSTWSNNEKSFQQINDLCSQGFDELNLLIQEQRSVCRNVFFSSTSVSFITRDEFFRSKMRSTFIWIAIAHRDICLGQMWVQHRFSSCPNIWYSNVKKFKWP